MKQAGLVLIISVIAGLALLSIITVHSSNTKITEAENARKARNAFEDIIDSTHHMLPFFNEGLKGKIIVMNVWIGWNQLSKMEIQEMNKLAKDFGNDKVVFMALNVNDSVNQGAILKRDSIQIDYRALYRQYWLVYALTSFEFEGEKNIIPLTAVINPEGKFEFYYTGFKRAKLEAIREYLASASK